MERNFKKSLESRITCSHYEIAPSMHKYNIENHINIKSLTNTLKENSEIKNFAEESAIKAEKELFELQEKNKKLKEYRENHLKHILKEKNKDNKKQEFKKFIKSKKQKNYSKEKQDKYEEMIRRKVVQKNKSSNEIINNIYVDDCNAIENLEQVENLNNINIHNKEFFYHTIRLNENGNLKTNMIINEYGDYNSYDNQGEDYKNGILIKQNHVNKINNNDNIKIKYEEGDYDFNNDDFDVKTNIYCNHNPNQLNDFNTYSNDFSDDNKFNYDSNNIFCKKLDTFNSNDNYIRNYFSNIDQKPKNNDSFNIFKENQDLFNKQKQLMHDKNIILEENENMENNVEDNNLEDNNIDNDLFRDNIIDKNKEIVKTNVINLRDDLNKKIQEKLNLKQKELINKNPLFKESKNENMRNKIIHNENSNSKIRDFLANSKLTFGDNLSQDIYNITSGNHQISNFTDFNYSNGNLKTNTNTNNYRNDKNSKNKSFDSINLHLNFISNNNCNINDLNKKNNTFSEQNFNNLKNDEVKKFLEKKINKTKSFRQLGNYIPSNKDINIDYDKSLDEKYERDSINDYNQNNFDDSKTYSSLSSNKDSRIIENGYRTYNMGLENKKRLMLKKTNDLNYTAKNSGWNFNMNPNKLNKR